MSELFERRRDDDMGVEEVCMDIRGVGGNCIGLWCFESKEVSMRILIGEEEGGVVEGELELEDLRELREGFVVGVGVSRRRMDVMVIVVGRGGECVVMVDEVIGGLRDGFEGKIEVIRLREWSDEEVDMVDLGVGMLRVLVWVV